MLEYLSMGTSDSTGELEFKEGRAGTNDSREAADGNFAKGKKGTETFSRYHKSISSSDNEGSGQKKDCRKSIKVTDGRGVHLRSMKTEKKRKVSKIPISEYTSRIRHEGNTKESFTEESKKFIGDLEAIPETS